MDPIQLVLISGVGGAGKTTALHTLEDLGFYCVDNLPLVLLPRLLDMLEPHRDIARVAIGFDIRDSLFLPLAPKVLGDLRARGVAMELLFLDAENQVIKRRYKETRRTHPLDRKGSGLDGAIARERRILRCIDPFVQTRIDTSALSPHQLRDLIRTRYGTKSARMQISVVSFGFKYGILPDADLVFDVRFLKNPYFVPALSRLTGLDREVAEYVFSDPDADQFVSQVCTLVDFLIPRYRREGKRYLTIGIGCTGGQHRSVAIAEEIARRHADDGWTVHHREMEKKNDG